MSWEVLEAVWRLCAVLLPGSVSQHAKLGMFLRVVAGIFVKWCRTCHSTQFCCNFCALRQRYELLDVAADVAAGEYASQLLGLSRAVCASSARGARSACQCCPVCCFSFFCVFLFCVLCGVLMCPLLGMLGSFGGCVQFFCRSLCHSTQFCCNFCALRQRPLPHLLFADGGDEFLEVERLEVGYVLEVAGAVGCEGGGEHR